MSASLIQRPAPFAALVVFLLGGAIGGCSRKADVQASVTGLEKAFAASTNTPATAADNATSVAAPANEMVKTALAAARANDYGASVIALQAAIDKGGATPQQVAAAQEAKRVMVTDLQNRAVRGDSQAISQLQAIEKSRSQ